MYINFPEFGAPSLFLTHKDANKNNQHKKLMYADYLK